jgi:hypothetical protein
MVSVENLLATNHTLKPALSSQHSAFSLRAFLAEGQQYWWAWLVFENLLATNCVNQHESEIDSR